MPDRQEGPLLNKLLNVFRIKELRTKLIFTVAMLCVYRIGFFIPIPGIDAPTLRAARETASGSTSSFAILSNYLSIFSGGDLTQGSIFGLGIMPYISASIIIQLLGTVVPSLEKLKKEGEPGMRKITEWTRYLTIAVCIIQAGFYVFHFAPRAPGYANLYLSVREGHLPTFMVLCLCCLTAGSVFLMWLGEQIDEYGIGNGVSLIITAGIIARMPQAVTDLFQFTSLKIGGGSNSIGPGTLVFILACFVFVVAGSILLTQAQRRIPVQQAKHMRGRRVYGGTKQYLPLRVNHAGVMPIIFASSLMMIPSAGLARLAEGATPNSTFGQVINFIARSSFPGTYIYEVIFCIMIFFFSYFWNTVQFQPKEMATQLRDYGSFIPGLRPGKRTADYLENVMSRITYVGAAFLCVIAILPSVVATWLLDGLPQAQGWQIAQFLGGTSLLIVISVMLDLVNRIEANLVMRNYGGFMDADKPNNKARRPRGAAARNQPQPAGYNGGNTKGLPA
jgi:preprotein translocase subunit SecY